jgi:LmbE family N-acetylglucosaminyl deacetylase
MVLIIIAINNLDAEDWLTAAWIAIVFAICWYAWNRKPPRKPKLYHYTFHQPDQLDALSDRYAEKAATLRAQANQPGKGLYGACAEHLDEISTGLKRAAKGESK